MNLSSLKQMKKFSSREGAKMIIRRKIYVQMLILCVTLISGCGKSTINHNSQTAKIINEEKTVTAGIDQTTTIPNIVGMNLEEGKKILAASDLGLGTVTEEVRFDMPPNSIINQFPKYGKSVSKQSSIDLVVNKKVISREDGIVLLEKTENQAFSFWKESNIGNKKYFFYSNEAPGDGVYCIDPVSRKILMYYSDGTLIDKNGTAVSKEKADWHKEQERQIVQEETKRQQAVSNRESIAPKDILLGHWLYQSQDNKYMEHYYAKDSLIMKTNGDFSRVSYIIFGPSGDIMNGTKGEMLIMQMFGANNYSSDGVYLVFSEDRMSINAYTVPNSGIIKYVGRLTYIDDAQNP